MLPIAAGVASFLLLLVHDWAELGGLRRSQAAAFFAAVALFLLSLGALLVSPGRFEAPLALRAAGGLFASAGLFVLFRAFSPLFRSFPGEPLLETGGLYSVCRHPGVPGLAVFLGGTVLASGSVGLLAASPIWILADALAALVEDRFFFPRKFGPAYGDYRERVPFLLPRLRVLCRLCHRTRGLQTHDRPAIHKRNLSKMRSES